MDFIGALQKFDFRGFFVKAHIFCLAKTKAFHF